MPFTLAMNPGREKVHPDLLFAFNSFDLLCYCFTSQLQQLSMQKISKAKAEAEQAEAFEVKCF